MGQEGKKITVLDLILGSDFGLREWFCHKALCIFGYGVDHGYGFGFEEVSLL